MDQLKTPPKWADRFLSWYCSEELIAEIQGDLYEQYQRNCRKNGAFQANRRFTLDVIRFFRPSSFKKSKLNMNSQILINYLKVAVRIFRKEKAYTSSNLVGLILGFITTTFIFLWVQDEMKYNSWTGRDGKIHYVHSNQTESNGVIRTWPTTPQPLREILQEQYPSIELAALTDWGYNLILKKGEENIEVRGLHASPELVDIFSLEFIRGDHELMWEQDFSIIISESMAIKFFGEDYASKDIVGEPMKDKDGDEFILAGIFKDIPRQSTLNFEFLVPFSHRLATRPWLTNWGNYSNRMYVRLAEGYTTESAIINVAPAITDNRPDQPDDVKLLLQEFSTLHLYNNHENGEILEGRMEYVRLLSISAILIIVLAVVNFMNLTAASATKRVRETGIRKVLGAFRSSLRTQFIVEAVLLTFLAGIITLVVVFLTLPYFNDLSGKDIESSFLTIDFIAIYLHIVLAIGLVSGLYPAFYMSSLNPVNSLKGVIKGVKFNSVFRKGLVVFQFIITIIMIVGSLTIYRQLDFIFTKNIGLDRQNVIRMELGDIDPLTDLQVFRDRLLNMPGIEGMTVVGQNPIEVSNSTSDPVWDGKDESQDNYFFILGIDPNFIPLMGVQLKEGRNLNPDLKSDTANFLINETAAELMGLEEPLNVGLEFWGIKGKIIGVVKDFHLQSLHKPIEPLIMGYDPEGWLALIKTKTGETQDAIASLETLHKEYNPNRQFDIDFMDDNFNEKYKSELLVSKLSFYFTIVAIVISCLGLLSLVSFSTALKTKEIGIRKVLGASIGSIISMIGKEYLALVIIGFVIAVPISFVVMRDWLEQFAFRRELDWSLYALSAFGALIITMLTIGNHALRSAYRNPVESLRDE